MSELNECTHDCASCSADCGDRQQNLADLLEKPHEMSHIKKVVGVISSKGGVGKSLITSMLAVLMNRKGYETAILDADVTGPSVPKAFGIRDKAYATDLGIIPIRSKTGVSIMSINLLLDEESDPVVWRGPILSGAVKQFWTDVIWGDVDFMFIDMPPGTGDVTLTVFQSLPLDGLIVITSPQELVTMIVEKAVKMANLMEIPILGIIENYSYVKCPDCDKHITVFGESHIVETAKKYNLKVLAKLPIDPSLSKACDDGVIELFEGDYLDALSDALEDL